MPDVPLEDAQIIWDTDGNTSLPPLKIVPMGGKDDDRYLASWGACNGDFANASDADKLRMLFLQYHQLVTFDGLAPSAVHDAFMQIPEYRKALSDFGSIAPIDEDEE